MESKPSATVEFIFAVLGDNSAPVGLRSLRYDVFISYAHEDREFVTWLRKRLEAAGFLVWLDEERMRAGGSVQDQIYQALLGSAQAVFVLSENSLQSQWSSYEVLIFGQEIARRKIAVLRSPLTPGQIPIDFLGHLHISWHDEQESDFSRFWRLCCGLREKEPGKREEWDRKGREACREVDGGSGVALLPGTPAEEEWRAARIARWGPGRAVWGCDRTEQWMKIETHAAKTEHEALFVVGRRGEGHNYFLDTVEECFPDKPERRIRKVFWGAKIPRDKDEFYRALAQALRSQTSEKAALKDALRLWLRDGNLVLVHRPVIPARLRDEALVLYYSRWLPELLGELGATRGVLKAVQGVDWSPSPLAPKSTPQETKKALHELRAVAHERLPVFLLPPLKPITRKHVESWAESLPKAQVNETTELVRDVLEGAHHSADILARIAERLCSAEEGA